jgi:hypothetical protein
MPTVYSRTVREAERLIGREQLCRALKALPAELDIWLSGSEEPPLEIFLKAVDIVLEKKQQ